MEALLKSLSKDQVANPEYKFLSEEKMNYLVASGFELYHYEAGKDEFFFFVNDNGTAIGVRGNVITSYLKKKTIAGRVSPYVSGNTYAGMEALSDLEWAMLLHVLRVIDIKENFKKVADELPIGEEFRPAF